MGWRAILYVMLVASLASTRLENRQQSCCEEWTRDRAIESQ